ncbi:tryptophan transporter [Marinisporobacter balticus]|uniref:Tryptophan transporter TrpP n=1 Tax=Marinisporobacter balticus TaxID=2018667 RepID=A0A4R2L703_9FIRM|nr:tryptophan transporter [Marinisporobacter balticus]TCO74985.1 tryptophan transporter TrpP [Marinisporobacter balticus]
MNLRKNIITALLIAIGFILRQIVPGVIGGMKFDLMLSVIFVCILINQEFKNVMLTALLGGVITAMTTTFPGGQLPNMIDKFITCIIVFMMIKMLGKYKNNLLCVGLIAFVGTLISGSIFLISASFIVGLPAAFSVLFIGVVVPTAFTNIFATIFIYKAVSLSIKATGLKFV